MSQSQPSLGQFQCPVQLSSRVRLPYCSLQVSLESGCPFGHLTGEPSSLRPIPQYICVGHLLNRCPFGVALAEQENSNDQAGSIVYCGLGLHPTARDLTEPEYFTERMVGTLLAMVSRAQAQQASSQPGSPVDLPPDDDQCGICLRWITASNRSYGNQELCSHPFCARCITEWYETRPNQESRRCPICRVRSDRILVWHRLVGSQMEKVTLLREQARAMNLSGNGTAAGGRAIVREHAHPLAADFRMVNIDRVNRMRRMVMRPNGQVQPQPQDPHGLPSLSEEDN